jgi:tetratricopeptide (TPR) repeat protein
MRCTSRLVTPYVTTATTTRTGSRRKTSAKATRFDPHAQIVPTSTIRRLGLVAVAALLTQYITPEAIQVARAGDLEQIETLEAVARAAYAERNFDEAILALTEIIKLAPREPRYLEMRADAYVDKKGFVDGLRDYKAALQMLGNDTIDKARVLSQVGLALEGLDLWDEAIESYNQSLELAKALGNDRDPYLLNSLGNCYASVGEWSQAREFYLESANSFQRSRSIDISMQKRLDGAIFSFSNAVLMDAQIGDQDDGAIIKRMQDLARRAPGSADMRAALAAMWWAKGESEKAEESWEFACNAIAVGCAKYEDFDWLRRVRRWPPVMVRRMERFVKLSKAEEVDAQP